MGTVHGGLGSDPPVSLPSPRVCHGCPPLGCVSASTAPHGPDRRRHVLIPDRLLMIPNPSTDSGDS